MKPRKKWFVRKAVRAGWCWICRQPTREGQQVTPYGGNWPHLSCAKAHDRRICHLI